MFEKWPKRYRIEFIEPGICDYTDDGQGKVFVSRDALNRFRNTFLGKPVINEDHIDLSPEEAFKLNEKSESLADGIVYNVGLNVDSGMDYADVFIWDLKTQDNIKSGYSASCMYAPEEIKKPGKWHNFLYDSEIIGGDYKHMAIVKNPRYERAKIYELPTELKNSITDNLEQIYKEGGKMDIFKIFKNKLKNEVPEKKIKNEVLEEKKEKMNADNSFIDIDGEKVPLSKLIECYQAEQSEETMVNEDDDIQIGEKKIKGKDLADSYRKAKKNEADAEAKKEDKEIEKENTAEEKTEEEKKAEEEKSKKVAENKKNNFNKLKNAVNSSNIFSGVTYETREDRLKAGAEKYGSGGAK